VILGMDHSGRSVLPNRSVRYFGTGVNSVPDNIGTDRFQKKFGTEVIRFRYFRFGIGKYRKIPNRQKQQVISN
jgi:hypothetical protein